MSLGCKGCTSRKVGCHATCQDYIERDMKNKIRRQKNLQERFLMDAMYELDLHRQKTRRTVCRHT